MSDVAASDVRALYRQGAMHGETRYAAHDVDAEFQTECVNLVGDGLKARAVCGGRETVFRRDEAAESVHAQLCETVILPVALPGLRLVPLNVAHDILPTVRF